VSKTTQFSKEHESVRSRVHKFRTDDFVADDACAVHYVGLVESIAHL
jgi:hypothetical protein